MKEYKSILLIMSLNDPAISWFFLLICELKTDIFSKVMSDLMSGLVSI